MNEERDVTDDDEELEPQQVVDYLKRNPGFIRHHPDLLAELDVPHQTSGAMSLIEEQVKVLRQRNASTERQLEELLRNARDNEAISQRLHGLALNLLSAATATDVLGLAYAALQDGFRAERCAVRIYQSAPQHESGCGEFVGTAGATCEAIEACMNSGRPAYLDEHSQAAALMFDGRVEGMRSGVLVPVTGATLRGVLSLMSADAARFSPNAGTLFLSQLGDLLAHSLLRVLR